MAFDSLPLNAGSGGSNLAFDSFTDTDSVVRAMAYGAIAFGPMNGPYVGVTSTVGLPVAQVSGSFWSFNFGQYGGSPVGASNAVHVQPGTGATFPVSAASLPLPTGAATAANQATEITALASILSALQGALTVTASGTVAVSNFPVTQPVSGTFWQATQPVSLASLPTLAAGTNLVGKVGIDQTTPGTTNAVAATNLPTTVDTNSGNKSASTIRVVLATDQPALTNAQPVNLQAATSGGASPYSYIAAASANQDSQVIKASAGQAFGWQLFNTSASVRYVKVYDKATAPTSADTPVKRFLLPAGGGAVVPQPTGITFASGIAFRITTGYADNDTGAATAGDVLVNANYK